MHHRPNSGAILADGIEVGGQNTNLRELPITPMAGCGRFGCPHEEPADRMSPVKRIEKAAHLITVPDIATLKPGQRHVPTVRRALR